MRPRIFVGSSREALPIAWAVQAQLEDKFDTTVWDQGLFRLTYSLLDGLLEVLDSSDAGIFILHPDDVTVLRGQSERSVRDNVLLELGMFIGRLGRDRTVMLIPRDLPVDLPSDLRGLTAAEYDHRRVVSGEARAAVGPACTRIREQFAGMRVRISEEPPARAKLDRAMARMSRDLEWLLDNPPRVRRRRADQLSVPMGRAIVEVVFGRIEDCGAGDQGSVVALPANEYFDDECIKDTRSSLGAFVQAGYGDDIDAFLSCVGAELRGLPVQRVPRAERRIDTSYGIGQAIFLRGLSPSVILVAATTERTGIGLRAEPHFLYAAMQGVVETMNANRLTTLYLPVLGSGHGGMPVAIALLFNLLALRSILSEDIGRHIGRVRVVVFRRDESSISEASLQDIIARVAG